MTHFTCLYFSPLVYIVVYGGKYLQAYKHDECHCFIAVAVALTVVVEVVALADSANMHNVA